MTEHSDETPETLISDGTRVAVCDILGSAGLDHAATQIVLSDINRAINVVRMMDLPQSPSATRDELNRLVKSIDELIGPIKGTSHFANFAMWDAVSAQHGKGSDQTFDGDGFMSDLVRLRKSAEHIRSSAQLALDEIVVPRGSPPNIQARHFAYHVAVALDQHSVKVNSTNDGTYFSVLDVLFSELLPTEDSASSHRTRHTLPQAMPRWRRCRRNPWLL